MPTSDDPIAKAWTAALRAQLDAVVAQFEAQLRQHVAYTTAQSARDLAGYEGRIIELEQTLAASRAVQSQQAAELARLQASLADREEEALALAAQVQSLDAQFVAERDFVAALLGADGSALFDAAQVSLGVVLEATPGCYGQVKTKRMDAVLTGAVRERGRSSVKSALTADERAALAKAAVAAGCELVEPEVGQRFNAATMDKAGERAEPADEGLVVACVMPGVRLVGTAGAVVHPRVIVGTA